MSFLPPSTRQAFVSTPLSEAPAVPSNAYLAESPLFLRSNVQPLPRSSQVDGRVRRADEHFAAGKKLYVEGDTSGARAEFDAAVDLLLSTPEDVGDRFKAEKKLEELVAAIHKYDVNGLGSGDLSATVSYDRAPLEHILEMTFPVDPKIKPKVAQQLGGTVSQLPLQINDTVLSYINFFSSEKGRRTLLSGLRRSGRYKALISRILAEEGVPQEMIYLAQAESGFLPRAVSHKSAVGMWQFMRARGREYGLNQTPYSDDRLDPEKATRSAARHLRDLYKKFGDWYLAIAGYNCGDGCVERAVERTGYADFWEIRARGAIPKETTNYVPIIVAMTLMHKNAKDYGIDDVEFEPPLEYETVELEAATHLGLIADVADRPVSEIRELNPALLKTVAPAGYELHVPPGTRTAVFAGLETIPPAKRISWRLHRVGEGDTIESIAKQYRMPAQSIVAANNDGDAELGDVLIIPTASQLEREKASATSSRARKASPKRGAASKSAKGPSKSARASVARSVETAGLR
jgi:membrane-bound lytic murein transglycosylase D